VTADEFEGRDLRAAVFWGVDLSEARFRDVNMTNVTISHGLIVDVDPFGLPNTGSADFGWPGLDHGSDPTLDEVLAVRAHPAARLRDYLDGVTLVDLGREADVLENGPTPVYECLYTVFEEEFEHNRYALRDLAPFE
jgi:hypothetical protein